MVAKIVAADACTLPPAARLVAIVLAERWINRRTLSTRSTPSGPPGPANATIARAAGLSPRTVQTALKCLDESGLIRIIRNVRPGRKQAGLLSEFRLQAHAYLGKIDVGTHATDASDLGKIDVGTHATDASDLGKIAPGTQAKSAHKPLNREPAYRTPGEIAELWPADVEPADRTEIESVFRTRLSIDPASQEGRDAIHWLIVTRFPRISEAENAVRLAEIRSRRRA